MSDHRIAPPRRGNGPEQRATRRNLSVLAQAEQQAMERERIAKRIGKREIALLAAGFSGIYNTEQAILRQAEIFLEWLEGPDASG